MQPRSTGMGGVGPARATRAPAMKNEKGGLCVFFHAHTSPPAPPKTHTHSHPRLRTTRRSSPPSGGAGRLAPPSDDDGA